MKQAQFAIIGGAGFRAQAFLRIARALPDHFRVTGLVVRQAEKGLAMEEEWGIPSYRTVEELLAQGRLDFIVVSAGKGAASEILPDLAERGIPVLLETPPASDLSGLHQVYEQLILPGARVQVAEQYHLSPLHAARLAVIGQGRLGRVTEATVSISQFYHAISLLRKYLNIGYEDAEVTGMRFLSPQIAGPGRAGVPQEEKLVQQPRDLVWFHFGDRLGIYDFTKDQHRSWIRSNHVSVRGERGEITDRRLNLLIDYQTPLPLELKRVNRGEEENLEGYFLEGILAGDSYAYRNPYTPARLLDDELAMAACLTRMAEYAAGGESFYSLAEACQDTYLGFVAEEAIRTGKTQRTEPQPWAER
jgi:hypothetical protein